MSNMPWIKGLTGVFALAVVTSLLLHAALLAFGFKLPQVNPDNLYAPPLELVLVNSKSQEPPDHADALAQNNLDGGGNTDQNRHAQSPLPASETDQQQQAVQATEQQVHRLEDENRRLMLQLRSQAAIAPSTGVSGSSEQAISPHQGNAADLRQQQEMSDLEARIAQQYDAYQKRPRKLFIGARTRAYAFARYVEDWRIKVERIGNANYPAVARERKMYGKLQLTVSIRADGSLASVEVTRSSGMPALDQAAIGIVRMAAPFSAFPKEMRRQADVIAITRTWSFEPGNQLNTQDPSAN